MIYSYSIKKEIVCFVQVNLQSRFSPDFADSLNAPHL